jgi:3-oxo-5-alpha-steroid 4-dehydrogenase 1
LSALLPTVPTLNLLALTWMALALPTWLVLLRVAAPFGRHTSERWGPTIDNRLGWVLMELPSLALMTGFLIFGARSLESYAWILFALWIAHYLNRTLIYPLRIRSTGKRMPLVIVLSAIVFNVINAGLNGCYLAQAAEGYGSDWLTSPSFIVGAVLFALGMGINLKADAMLMRLRQPGESGYRIPRGFLFEQVSSPNLFGEMIEWSGFALMAWNLPALSFCVWTIANLLPRARHHHDWYKARFADYPPDRRIAIPFVY